MEGKIASLITPTQQKDPSYIVNSLEFDFKEIIRTP